MDLRGKFVRFWLSPDGEVALKDVIRTDRELEALVVEEDNLGFWIWVPEAGKGSREVTLLKREYFAAVSVVYEPPEAAKERPPAGFRA